MNSTMYFAHRAELLVRANARQAPPTPVDHRRSVDVETSTCATTDHASNVVTDLEDRAQGRARRSPGRIRKFCTVCDCSGRAKIGIVVDGRIGFALGPEGIESLRVGDGAMAKRNRRSSNGLGLDGARPKPVVEDVSLAEATRSRYLNYALSVITSRALPDVRDGLKPVQRRILYAMWHDLHVTADGRYMKCAAVVGEVMKSYHPHGDQSIYDALVRMAQPFSLRHPLVEGYGNFGSIDGDPPAAMRYTECRLTPIAAGAARASCATRRSTSGRTTPRRPRSRSSSPPSSPTCWSTAPRGSPSGWRRTSRRTTSRRSARPSIALLDDRELPLEKLTPAHPRARLPDRRRDPEHGRRDPPDLRDRPGVDQAPRDLRARPREAEHRPDHLDPLRDREGRPGRSGSAS